MTNGDVEFKVEPRFGAVDITVAEYIQLFVGWLNRLSASGVPKETTDFYLKATQTRIRQLLQGVDYEKLEILPGTQEWHGAIWDRKLTARRPGDVSALALSEIPYTFNQLGLQDDVLNIPFYKEVIAPKAYEAMAITQARQYGYEPESPQEATLLRQGIDASNKYQNQTIANILAEPALTEERFAGVGERRGIVTGRTEEEIAKAHERVLGQAAIAEQAFIGMGEQEAARREKVAQQWASQMQAAYLPEAQIPSPAPGIREFLAEERPAGLQGFIQEKLPSVLEEFERTMGGARRAWWTAINQPTHQQALAEAQWEVDRWSKITERGFKERMAQTAPAAEPGLAGQVPSVGEPPVAAPYPGGMSPDEWLMNIAPQKLTEAMQRLGQIEGLSPEQVSGAFPTAGVAAMEDPLEKYVKEYPWQAKFLELSPQQRGFSYQRYSPSARWFTT